MIQNELISILRAWSLCMGRLPQMPRKAIRVDKPPIVSDKEDREWIPYTDDGMPLERNCTQPGNLRTVYNTFCKLSEIVHETMFVLYKPESRLTSRTILAVYTKYLDWYNSLPDILRLGKNFTPTVLFTQ
jgi:hypothetical protein